jgi:hypothetical protein
MKRYVPLLIGILAFLTLQPIVVSLSAENIPLNVLIYVLLLTIIYAVGPPVITNYPCIYRRLI